mmetsp:Transcript_18885/g.28719  ORF Transcript_18885/g.28719 Transcript_18885/m.28719 type:complete len:92 (+) Transcript_18885:1807-2082(+)
MYIVCKHYDFISKWHLKYISLNDQLFRAFPFFSAFRASFLLRSKSRNSSISLTILLGRIERKLGNSATKSREWAHPALGENVALNMSPTCR